MRRSSYCCPPPLQSTFRDLFLTKHSPYMNLSKSILIGRHSVPPLESERVRTDSICVSRSTKKVSPLSFSLSLWKTTGITYFHNLLSSYFVGHKCFRDNMVSVNTESKEYRNILVLPSVVAIYHQYDIQSLNTIQIGRGSWRNAERNLHSLIPLSRLCRIGRLAMGALATNAILWNI